MLASSDLIGVGLLGETARRAASGDRVTYGRVCAIVSPMRCRPDPGEAGEVRLLATPASLDEARACASAAAPFAGGRAVHGLFACGLCWRSPATIIWRWRTACRALHDAGLEAIAEAPIDRLGDTDERSRSSAPSQHGGLAVRRATIRRAPIDVRLDLIETAAAIQRETNAFKAFAPLPRIDPADAPATGYDDVRTVAAARLMCRSIPFIQVDWPLYGPKLAQVAIAYGANDIDGVAAADRPDLGPRRSPREEIERQIRAAFRDARRAQRAVRGASR